VTLGRPLVVSSRGRCFWSAIAVAFSLSMAAIVWDNILTAVGFPSQQEDYGRRRQAMSCPAQLRRARRTLRLIARTGLNRPDAVSPSVNRSRQFGFLIGVKAPIGHASVREIFGALGQGRGGHVIPMSYPIASDKADIDRFSKPVCADLP
jgi:hypothetical protein